MNSKDGTASILFINYDRQNRFFDYEIFSGEISKVITDLKNFLTAIIPVFYTRENFIGEYKNEIDIEIIDSVFKDLSTKCDIFKDNIVIEYSQKLKYLKILYTKKELNSKTKKSNSLFEKVNLDILKKYKEQKYLQISHDDLNGSYIIYFSSIKRTNLFKNSKSKQLTKSELKVYDLISKSNYPLSREDIVMHTLLSPRTVSYAVGQLVENNFIKKINTSKNELSRANKMNKYVKNVDDN